MSETVLCINSNCTDTCRDTCATSTCRISRKHRTGKGVCCMSCSDVCFDCGDTFYWEGLHTLPDEEPDDEGELVEVHLCHCCHLRRQPRENG